MGITNKDIELLDNIISKYNPKNVIELGAQNLYIDAGKMPVPYANEYYEAKGIEYHSIDLSKENGCIVLDLSKPLSEGKNTIPHKNSWDLVTDFGTSEHVGDDGKFGIEAYYNCWKNKYDLCKPGGIIISVNPKSGNWPGHGFNYVDRRFYGLLVIALVAEDIILEEHPAMGNITDGWNMICIFKKSDKEFISLEQFKLLDTKTS